MTSVIPAGAFPIRGAVDPTDVVGRRQFADRLKADVTAGQALILMGPRRTGKSSVAGLVAEELRADKTTPHAIVQIDLEHISELRDFTDAVFDACNSLLGQPQGLMRMISGEVARRASVVDLKLKAGPFAEVGVQLALEKSETSRLNTALGLLATTVERLGLPILVVLDEFQEGGKLHQDFYKNIRFHVGKHKTQVRWLFLGSQASMLQALYAKSGSPLYRALLPRKLPDPQPEEWLPFLTDRFRSLGISFEPDALEVVTARCGGFAQDVMKVAHELFVSASLAHKNKLTAGDCEAGVEAALEELDDSFDELWARIGQDRGARLAVARIANGRRLWEGLSKTDQSAVQHSLKGLEVEGIVVKLGRAAYALREPLFAEHLSRKGDAALRVLLPG